MSRKRKVSEDGKPIVPLYMFTFANILILLLAFFVLLLTLAKERTEEQTAELFTAGQSAFKHALTNFGLSGSLSGTDRGLDSKHPKAKYKVDKEQDEPDDRSIDSQLGMLRSKLLDVEKTTKMLPSQIVGVSKTFTVTDIHFERGRWSLNKSAKQFLRTYCSQLQESLAAQAVTLYVVGLAGAERSAKQQWIVSAHRAEAVARFIKSSLSEQSDWSIYCWGAGTGGDWSGARGLISKEADIAIVTLTER